MIAGVKLYIYYEKTAEHPQKDLSRKVRDL